MLGDLAEAHALLGVQRHVFVGAAHHHVLTAAEPAHAVRVITQVPVLPDLQRTITAVEDQLWRLLATLEMVLGGPGPVSQFFRLFSVPKYPEAPHSPSLHN